MTHFRLESDTRWSVFLMTSSIHLVTWHHVEIRSFYFLSFFPFILRYWSSVLPTFVIMNVHSHIQKKEEKLKLKAVFMQIDWKDSDYKKIVGNTVWKWLARRRITITISSDESTTDGRRMEEAIGFASQSIQRMKAFQFGLEMRFFTYFSGFSAVCRSQQKS